MIKPGPYESGSFGFGIWQCCSHRKVSVSRFGDLQGRAWWEKMIVCVSVVGHQVCRWLYYIPISDLIWCSYFLTLIQTTEQSALHTELHGCWRCPQASPRRSLLPRCHRRARSFLLLWFFRFISVEMFVSPIPSFCLHFFILQIQLVSLKHTYRVVMSFWSLKRVNLFSSVNNPKKSGTTLNEAFLGLLYPTVNYKV